MRYGHLLAAILFAMILGIGLMLILMGPSTKNKIGVTPKGSGGAIATGTPQGFYTEPQSAKTAAVTYTENGFSPAALTIAAGTTVIFDNRSGVSFWPASDPHPAHSAYPVQGTCSASLFDACTEITPGRTWALKFDMVGSWKYHNHLKPEHTGVIVVK